MKTRVSLLILFLVQSRKGDHTLAETTATVKEAFTKAVGWPIAESFTDVSIQDGIKIYPIDEFASVMALHEIANTVASAGAMRDFG